MGKPLMLDAYCGAGGAAMGYHRAGFRVIGVDHVEQPNYPFEFVLSDAVEYIRAYGGEYAAVHASPPCQSFSAYRRKGAGVGAGHVNLIPATREKLIRIGRPWVIENVPGAHAELRSPVQMCGSAFNLDIQRHRLFESTFSFSAPPCNHSWQTPRFPPATNRTNLRRTVEIGVWRIPLPQQQRAMGIRWMTLEELSQAIPPAYTEYIGRQLIDQL